jgi:hypothetical protein
LRTDRHEGLLTSVMDAEPETRYEFKEPTILPLLLALAGGGAIIAAIFTPWGVTVGAILTFIILFCWYWPTISPDHDTPRTRKAEGRRRDPPCGMSRPVRTRRSATTRRSGGAPPS